MHCCLSHALPRCPPARPQDGGKFRVSRKAVLVADGLIPAAPAGGAATAAASASDGEQAEMPEVGRIYRGCRITGIAGFGAFVEVCAGQWLLCC